MVLSNSLWNHWVQSNAGGNVVLSNGAGGNVVLTCVAAVQGGMQYLVTVCGTTWSKAMQGGMWCLATVQVGNAVLRNSLCCVFLLTTDSACTGTFAT